jgi:ABC-2 type transport system permease protein
MLTIIIPASVNATVAAIYPVPEAFKTTLDSREAYHSKWDKAKEPTIEKFYQHYPQFRKYKHPQGHDYSWLWYYAAQQMADDESWYHLSNSKKNFSKENVSFKSLAG